MEGMSLRRLFYQRAAVLVFALMVISLLMASTGHASSQNYVRTEQQAGTGDAQYYMVGGNGDYIFASGYRDIREYAGSLPITVSQPETVTFYYFSQNSYQLVGVSNITTAAQSAPGLLKGTIAANSEYVHYEQPSVYTTSAAYLTSRFLIDDLMFINTANPAATGTINNVTLNFRLTGSFTNDNLVNESFRLDYFYDTENCWMGAGAFNSSGYTHWSGPLFKNLASYHDIDEVFSLTLGKVDYGTPVCFGFEMNLYASVSDDRDPEGNTNVANFTLAFVNDQLLFTLPDGFTVNSDSGGIVDNQFTGGSPVPLPASAWLFLSGLAGLGLLGKRKNRQNHKI
jgi:hypothetical protein